MYSTGHAGWQKSGRWYFPIFTHPVLCFFPPPSHLFFIFFFFCIAFPKGLQEKPSLQRAQKRKFTPQAISVNQFPTTGTDLILNIWLLMLADLPTLPATGLCHGFAQKGGLKGQIPESAAGLFKTCDQVFVQHPCNPQLLHVMEIPLWPYEEC